MSEDAGMPEPPRREATIFEAARQLPPEQRQAYLDQACVGETSLRQAVEGLLKAHEQAGAFLDNPGASSGVPSRPLRDGSAGEPAKAKAPNPTVNQIGRASCRVRV